MRTIRRPGRCRLRSAAREERRHVLLEGFGDAEQVAVSGVAVARLDALKGSPGDACGLGEGLLTVGGRRPVGRRCTRGASGATCAPCSVRSPSGVARRSPRAGRRSSRCSAHSSRGSSSIGPSLVGHVQCVAHSGARVLHAGHSVDAQMPRDSVVSASGLMVTRAPCTGSSPCSSPERGRTASMRRWPWCGCVVRSGRSFSMRATVSCCAGSSFRSRPVRSSCGRRPVGVWSVVSPFSPPCKGSCARRQGSPLTVSRRMSGTRRSSILDMLVGAARHRRISGHGPVLTARPGHAVGGADRRSGSGRSGTARSVKPATTGPRAQPEK